jgi:ABC-2 type transport system permease protein
MNLFKMELRRNFKTMAIWAIVCGALTLLLTLLYPAMLGSDMLALMNAKLASLPKELVDMFNLSSEDIRQLPQFFAYFFQFVMMAACVYGATLGLSVISREESEGTIEFLYAKPLRRAQIVTGKLLSAAATFAIYFVVVAICGMIGCMAVKPEALDTMVLLTGVKSVMTGGFIAGITYMFIGLVLSVLLRRPKHSASLASALFFGTFIVGSIPKITGVLDFLKWVSPINYVMPSDVVMEGLDGVYVLILLTVMAVTTGLTYIIYNKRDLMG